MQRQNPTGGAPPYIRGLPAKSPTWSFARVVFNRAAIQVRFIWNLTNIDSPDIDLSRASAI